MNRTRLSNEQFRALIDVQLQTVNTIEDLIRAEELCSIDKRIEAPTTEDLAYVEQSKIQLTKPLNEGGFAIGNLLHYAGVYQRKNEKAQGILAKAQDLLMQIKKGGHVTRAYKEPREKNGNLVTSFTVSQKLAEFEVARAYAYIRINNRMLGLLTTEVERRNRLIQEAQERREEQLKAAEERRQAAETQKQQALEAETKAVNERLAKLANAFKARKVKGPAQKRTDFTKTVKADSLAEALGNALGIQPKQETPEVATPILPIPTETMITKAKALELEGTGATITSRKVGAVTRYFLVS